MINGQHWKALLREQFTLPQAETLWTMREQPTPVERFVNHDILAVGTLVVHFAAVKHVGVFAYDPALIVDCFVISDYTLVLRIL